MASNLYLSKPQQPINCTIELTGSKSESNRALILRALSSGKVRVLNLSQADDTVVLDKSLSLLNTGMSEEQLIDIGPAGTAMRFLSSYLAISSRAAVLTGSARMKQRPIGILVDALRELGARIDYADAAGYPPLRFHAEPFVQQKRSISIKGNISSQYITSLLLAGASLPLGLDLHIEGELTSRPYVEMTLGLLQESGIAYSWTGDVISIAKQDFANSAITVEPDWSAASYWYAVVALADKACICLPHLKQNSLQGDSRIRSIMQQFGVESEFTADGLLIKRHSTVISGDFFDLKDCPDLAQTVIVVAAALGHNATFTGLETLRIKETDRIAALQNELAKIGVKIHEDGQLYHLDCSGLHFPAQVSISTYEDHRMAMAFAPLSLKLPGLAIEDPAVVGKSYPTFWTDLAKAGFNIEGL